MPEPTQATWEMLESEQAHAASWKAEYDATFTKLTQLATERDALLEALRDLLHAESTGIPSRKRKAVDAAQAAIRKVEKA